MTREEKNRVDESSPHSYLPCYLSAWLFGPLATHCQQPDPSIGRLNRLPVGPQRGADQCRRLALPYLPSPQTSTQALAGKAWAERGRQPRPARLPQQAQLAIFP